MIARHLNLSPAEWLAITSQFVGHLIAHQDQRRYSSEEAVELVQKNMETGNRAAIESQLGDTQGSA